MKESCCVHRVLLHKVLLSVLIRTEIKFKYTEYRCEDSTSLLTHFGIDISYLQILRNRLFVGM